MSDKPDWERSGELPLDFTQFLSGRLGVETSRTLAMLGSFLVEFEPSRRHQHREALSPFVASGFPPSTQ
jgi:hypothetical protein